MKNYRLLFAGAFLFSCNAGNNNKSEISMPGVYQMEYQEIDNNGETTKFTDLHQLKIYTDDYFMYTQLDVSDTTYAFGVGTYRVDNDSNMVYEQVIFSASGETADSSGQEYPLIITTNIDGYKQVIPNITIQGENVQLTESYKRSKAQETSPLDGVWKETRFYTIMGNDTTFVDRVQYKTFYSGYFMWGQVFNDSTGKQNTAMGFGSFTMPDATHLKETDLNSTYAITPGQTFDVEIEMMGNDQYRQTLPNSDGSRNVEEYQRLKK